MRGIIFLPGDKSIAHRAIILSALGNSTVTLKNIPLNQDSLATISSVRKLGVKIKLKKASCQAIVFGKGLFGLSKPVSSLLIKESGTTFRLLLGVLAGQDFKSKLRAGPALSRRPMLRVIKPLRLMGAEIPEEYPPITILGGGLKGITYKVPVASAQVKGSLLLAGLFAQGETRIIEPVKTRDHTERMLKLFKAKIKFKGNAITITGGRELVSPANIFIPADISSASFFMVGSCITPSSRVIIKNVSLNPGRIGVIKALKRMGAAVKIQKSKFDHRGNEPVGDIQVVTSALRAIRIRAKEIPSLIDELPILMVAACFAKGVSVFESAGELRVKETDRIKSMVTNLTKMGADIKIIKLNGQENIIIRGVKQLAGARVKSFGDHRTAMSLAIAGLAAKGKTRIDNLSCINKSFPDFLSTLKRLI